MADEKSWWEKVPEPIASIKGNALWAAICVAFGSCINGFFTAKILNRPLVVAAYVALASIGIAFMIGGVISFLRARANNTAVQNRHKSSDPCCKRGLYVPGTGVLRLRSAAVS
jgi:predicted phage tail protein